MDGDVMADDTDFLGEIKENYREATTGWNEIYEALTNDMKFVYDIDEGQWPENIRNQRENDRRPMITANKLQKTLRRIRGDGMMNRPSMKVIPVDSKNDPAMAKLYSDLIRQIEYLSSADIAYDTAYNHALSSSIGYFRIISQYESDESFNKELRIKRIINPLSVRFDPYASEFNLEDAKYAFVDELVDKNLFEKLYPNAEMSDFDSSNVATLFGDWLQSDKVRVAEYFYKEPVQKKILLLSDGSIEPANKFTLEAMQILGLEVVRERTVNTHQVKWCKLSGGEILEKKDWPGKYIPIIPMFGDEVVADGKRHYLSLARGAKGTQQMYNYWATAATETVALAPKMPFIVDHRQIKDFETEWEDANLHNRMFIRYNAVQGLQKPSREPQAQIPTAIMAMMQSTAYDIEDHLGQYESSRGEASNERSRVAIDARVRQSDKGTYLFVNNRTRAMIYGGKQLIDLIPKIYDTERAIQVMDENGESRPEMINMGAPEGKINDLSVGKYDLIASVGASFSSQRQAMVDTMERAMQYAGPEIAAVIAPLLFKYSDAPGATEISAELTKAMEKLQQQQAAQ